MEDFGLGGFTPSEALLVMNRLAKTSDFLAAGVLH